MTTNLTLIGDRFNNTLKGGAGDDILNGAGGNDRMSGLAGNDTYHVQQAGDVIVEKPRKGTDTVLSYLTNYTLGPNVENGKIMLGSGGRLAGNNLHNELSGGLGDDRLVGYGGNDSLIGGRGNDKMYGGAGDDTYSVQQSGDQVFEKFGEGTDTVLSYIKNYILGANVENGKIMYSGKASLTGNILDNTLSGSGFNDQLFGGKGADRIDGGAGNDTINGGAGNDTLRGGDGKDRIHTESGNDTVFAGNGDDFIFGGAGQQNVHGGAGYDKLYGERGGTYYVKSVEAYYGSTYRDVVLAAPGLIKVSTNAGNDTVFVGKDLKVVNGGDGDDTIQMSKAGKITIDFREEYSIFNGKTKFRGIEHVLGTSGNDTIVISSNKGKTWFMETNAGAGDDIIYGSSWGERLNGGKGADHIFGGDGGDELVGDNAKDVLEGGAGVDTYRLYAQGITMKDSLLGLFYEQGDDFNEAIVYYNGSLDIKKNWFFSTITLDASVSKFELSGSPEKFAYIFSKAVELADTGQTLSLKNGASELTIVAGAGEDTFEFDGSNTIYYGEKTSSTFFIWDFDNSNDRIKIKADAIFLGSSYEAEQRFLASNLGETVVVGSDSAAGYRLYVGKAQKGVYEDGFGGTEIYYYYDLTSEIITGDKINQDALLLI